MNRHNPFEGLPEVSYTEDVERWQRYREAQRKGELYLRDLGIQIEEMIYEEAKLASDSLPASKVAEILEELDNEIWNCI